MFDVVLLDPPRAGCSRAFLQALCEAGPQRIVYISCNPATLARDAKIMSTFGFRIEHVQPVDMFPHTQHVETVVLLCRKAKQADRHIVVNYETQGRHMKKNK